MTPLNGIFIILLLLLQALLFSPSKERFIQIKKIKFSK